VSRRLFLAVLVWGALLGNPAAAGAADSAIRVVETSRYGATAAPPAAVVYPVAVLRGSGWEEDLIQRAIGEAEAIFKQCDVVVTAGTVYWLEAPDRYHTLAESDQAALLQALAPRRPAALFINRTAARDTAYSYLHDAPVPSRGTAWLTRRVADSCAGALLAHELGHILLHSPRHSTQPGNLMAAACRHSNIKGAAVNDRLSGAQCERLRNELKSRGIRTEQSND